jgi:tRNA (guanine-N7-)-methyltransferase
VSLRRSRRLPLEELSPFLLAIPEPQKPFDWRTVFGNDRPVELEIGSGKGLFLLTASQTLPGTNFVGIEIARKYQLFTANRIAKRNLTNVRLTCADGRLFLRKLVDDESSQGLHVYFPDPWWKKRHAKRRLWTAEFAADCARVLSAGGRLSIATDVEEYFGVITDLLAQRDNLQPLPEEPEQEKEDASDYLTNFERKARLVGQRVFRRVYEKLR